MPKPLSKFKVRIPQFFCIIIKPFRTGSNKFALASPRSISQAVSSTSIQSFSIEEERSSSGKLHSIHVVESFNLSLNYQFEMQLFCAVSAWPQHQATKPTMPHRAACAALSGIAAQPTPLSQWTLSQHPFSCAFATTPERQCCRRR